MIYMTWESALILPVLHATNCHLMDHATYYSIPPTRLYIAVDNNIVTPYLFIIIQYESGFVGLGKLGKKVS